MMARDLSKYENWCATQNDNSQAIIVFSFKTEGIDAAGVTDLEVLEDLQNWWPIRACLRNCSYGQANLQAYYFASNIHNKNDPQNPFIYQKAEGKWSTRNGQIMKNLKLKIVQKADGTYFLQDDQLNANVGDGWSICKWKVDYGVETNPFSPPDLKKLFCDEITFEKMFNDSLVKLITRHGWREY